MANYYGNGRSNYVAVTDKDKFKKLCDERNLEFWEEKNGTVGCGSNDEGGEPNDYIEDEDTGEEVEMPDFMEEVSKILKDEEVFIWSHVGQEKLRYLTGYSMAINNKGKTVGVNIDDIYKKAKKLGKNITQASY